MSCGLWALDAKAHSPPLETAADRGHDDIVELLEADEPGYRRGGPVW